MSAPAGALSHLRAIEVGAFIAGPFCGQILADLGMDVIKVEPPGRGDAMRTWGAARTSNGKSLWWPVIGRNKRSLSLDLRKPDGRDILRRLVAEADVLIENFRPGTLERWGLAPEDLRRDNPSLIVARVSGFGQTGPYSEKAGFGAVAEAMAGLRTLTGYPDRPSTRVGISIGDSLAGLYAAIGVLTAVVARGQRAGAGQTIDVSIAEAVLGVMESILSEQAATGAVRTRSGPVLPKIAPSNVYPTAEGGEVVIAANADGLFRHLCEAMGRPDLADDPAFATHEARGARQAELDAIIGAWTKDRPRGEVIALMDRHGIPAGPVNDAAAVVSDPHFRARGAIVEVPDVSFGSVTMQGPVPKLDGTPGTIRWTGPEVGAHTRDILADALGLDAASLDRLAAEGVI
ncbi:CaiB/BaiF CoA transferase family protein [Xanthobacter tagetidis]|uniref:CoA transferase n=1 Tax=Xanthobacter tagetidis TaxID=60216 RepID=A0A3L7AE17_9HYPH|nr:CoA transferase [Xanthobacter tagetidis]MBB6308598.1 formyl-CoA transferase/succinyl-CoA--D-citramalate CoA-transferase [Xanthobacter tagetidis]RLP78639.1 CoA transferase [Xanthobacter tagetidis]